MSSRKRFFVLLASLLAAGADAQPADATSPGELIVEPPTLISLGFEWRIEGDANRNAAVRVQYRRDGEASWREGLPLLRIGGERTVYANTLDYTAPPMLAGSLLRLEPDTTYEARFTLSDPDGVLGAAERAVEVTTRAEPSPYEGGNVYHVYPPGFEADGAMHNIRMFENRCFNAATGAMSPQPIFGGPVYFVRNVVYNGVYGPLKIQADPSGILVYQNTDGYTGDAPDLGAYELGRERPRYGPRSRSRQ